MKVVPRKPEGEAREESEHMALGKAKARNHTVNAREREQRYRKRLASAALDASAAAAGSDVSAPAAASAKSAPQKCMVRQMMDTKRIQVLPPTQIQPAQDCEHRVPSLPKVG